MLTLRTVLGDERGFVHKRLFRGITGAIGGLIGGGPGGVVGGAVSGFLRRPTPGAIAVRCPQGFSPNADGTCGSLHLSPAEIMRRSGPPAQLASVIPSSAAGACPPGFLRTPLGCVPATLPALQQQFFPQQRGDAVVTDGLAAPDQFGPARLGRFGAALEPEVRDLTVRRCPRGSVLGVDGLCYNRRDISNKERFWPRGRRPLLTGGDMRCISVASSAAKKLQRKQKQLEELGLLRKPARRGGRRAAPAGHVGVIKHA